MEGRTKIAVLLFLVVVGFSLAGYCFYTNKDKGEDFKKSLIKQRNVTNKKLFNQKEQFHKKQKDIENKQRVEIERFSKQLMFANQKANHANQKANQAMAIASSRENYSNKALESAQTRLNNVLLKNNQKAAQERYMAKERYALKQKIAEPVLKKHVRESFLPAAMGEVAQFMSSDITGMVGSDFGHSNTPEESLRAAISITTPLATREVQGNEEMALESAHQSHVAKMLLHG